MAQNWKRIRTELSQGGGFSAKETTKKAYTQKNLKMEEKPGPEPAGSGSYSSAVNGGKSIGECQDSIQRRGIVIQLNFSSFLIWIGSCVQNDI